MASYLPFLLAFVSAYLVVCDARPQLPTIPREFQNINFEQYLRNERAMKFQLKCVLYNGPCDTIGKFIKRNIPLALRTQCKNCDEDQKKLAAKFISFLQMNYPKEYDDALAKYGKTHYTDEEIEQFEKELGIKIIRDRNAPTRAPGQKPDVDGLVALAKEGIHAAVHTKAPIILGRQGSNTTINVAKITLPANIAKYTATTPLPSSSSSTTTAAPSSSEPAPSSSTVAEAMAEETTVIGETEAATEAVPESS